jgi:hypothetical protein
LFGHDCHYTSTIISMPTVHYTLQRRMGTVQ